MPKKPPKLRPDVAQIAYRVMLEATGQAPKTLPPDERQRARYSPPVRTGALRLRKIGRPDPDLVSTSYVERSNLTLRMQSRRYTRLTNTFSKKAENHAHAASLFFLHYNYCRPHQTLTKAAQGLKPPPRWWL